MNGLPAEFERRILEWAYEAAEEISRHALEANAELSPPQKAVLRKKLEQVRAEEILAFVERVEAYKHENYVWPTEDAILNLPKDELAHVAQALVNLNLLKKRMSMVPETVGGPIDAAVISKGDGFIWIERKHYFLPSKNPHFMRNRYKDSVDADLQEQA